MDTSNEKQTGLEERRLAALKRYDILDTPPDGSFDRITRLASKLFNVPIAIVSLVDSDRVWFKSHYGLDIPQIDRNAWLSDSALLSDDVYLVEDAFKDPGFLANPMAAGMLKLRFYASAPLRTREGYNLGTFCIIDKDPRNLSDIQRMILQDLADIVMDEIELRLEARTAIKKRNQLLNIAMHELKGPLTTIPIRADLIKEESGSETIETMCDHIKNASLKMNRTINELLEAARIEIGEIRLRMDLLDFANSAERVVSTNQHLAEKKNQRIQLKIENHPIGRADENRLGEIIDNLINNAIKFSPEHRDIHVTISERNSKAILEVEDEGIGLTPRDKNQLFQRFTRLNSSMNGGQDSVGIGLFTVKKLVEAHNGTIRAESHGKDKGSKFTVEIPLID